MKRGIPIIGIVFLVISFFLASAGIKSITKDSPMEKQTVENAIYLGATPPSVENEGQIIIINGTVEILKPAYDKENELSIHSPRATKDTYVFTPDDKDNEDWVLCESEDLLGTVKVSGYIISTGLTEKFKVRSTYKDFEQNELEAAGLRLVEDSRTPQRFFLKSSGDQVRYHYEAFDMTKSDKVTITARQSGDVLENIEAMKKYAVVEGEFTREELLKYMQDDNLTSRILGFSMSILFFGLGAFRIWRWFGIKAL